MFLPKLSKQGQPIYSRNHYLQLSWRNEAQINTRSVSIHQVQLIFPFSCELSLWPESGDQYRWNSPQFTINRKSNLQAFHVCTRDDHNSRILDSKYESEGRWSEWTIHGAAAQLPNSLLYTFTNWLHYFNSELSCYCSVSSISEGQ